MNRQDATGRTPRIAIVGGGPGGLFTAWHIERLAAVPAHVTIFEAAGRLGGKVLTCSFAAARVRYEAGAAELYDSSPLNDDPLRRLVDALGLSTVPLGGTAVYVDGRRIANLDDMGDVLGWAARHDLVEFNAVARGTMTPREYYESGSDLSTVGSEFASGAPRFADLLAGIGTPAARRYVETMIHSDLATEPATTTIGYGLQNYLMNDPAYMRLYRIAGGNERLIGAVAGRLAATVRLESVVTEIGRGTDDRLTLSWWSGGRVACEEFDVVILALPLGPLADLACRDPVLAAALGRHVAHHDHPAHYLRISMLLDRPVEGVPGADDFLMVDAFDGACLYIETGRDPTATHGVLGWLLGGAAAAEQARRSDEELAAAARDALPAPLAAFRDRILETRVHRWTGAVSALPGGWKPLPVDHRHRPSAAHPGLFVVGDYLYDSTLNGVLESAEHVAGWVAAGLVR